MKSLQKLRRDRIAGNLPCPEPAAGNIKRPALIFVVFLSF
jgi:hypothetical protein